MPSTLGPLPPPPDALGLGEINLRVSATQPNPDSDDLVSLFIPPDTNPGLFPRTVRWSISCLWRFQIARTLGHELTTNPFFSLLLGEFGVRTAAQLAHDVALDALRGGDLRDAAPYFEKAAEGWGRAEVYTLAAGDWYVAAQLWDHFDHTQKEHALLQCWNALMDEGKRLEATKNWEGAMNVYSEARLFIIEACPGKSDLAERVILRMRVARSHLARDSGDTEMAMENATIAFSTLEEEARRVNSQGRGELEEPTANDLAQILVWCAIRLSRTGHVEDAQEAIRKALQVSRIYLNIALKGKQTIVIGDWSIEPLEETKIYAYVTRAIG